MVHLVLSIYLVFCVGQILLKYSEIVINLVKQSLADFLFMRWHAEHHVLVVFRFLTLQYMLILQFVLNSLIGLRIHFHISYHLLVCLVFVLTIVNGLVQRALLRTSD